jgi:hypothetical protein
MSKEQQRQLDAILRQGGLDPNADVPTLRAAFSELVAQVPVAPDRAAFSELVAQVPVAPDVQRRPVELGGVAGVEVTIQGHEADNLILYFTPVSTSSAPRQRPFPW